MKGQIFVLGAIGLIVALFLTTSNLQKEIYLPKVDEPLLENIAKEYNYWIAYSSIEGNYNLLNFGNFVKENYPTIEFFYLLAEEDNLKVANFFDSGINFKINGKDFSLNKNDSVNCNFSGKINFSSKYKNFTYKPKNRFSGAIFFRIDKEITKPQLLKVFE